MDLHVLLTVFSLLVYTSSVDAVGYGYECSTASDCPGENFQCIKVHPSCSVSVCLCKEGFDSMGGRCLPGFNPGQHCTANSTCRPPFISSCSDLLHICECDYGLVEKDGECLAGDKLLSEACTDNGDCKGYKGHPHDVICIDGVCACYAYLAEDKVLNRCHLVESGGSCKDSECMPTYDCMSGSNTCQCKEGYSQRELSVRFSKNMHPYVDNYIHDACIADTADTEVEAGGECEVPGGVESVMKMCKTGLVCEYCSNTGPHTGPHVCVTNDVLPVGNSAAAATGALRTIMLVIPVLLLVSEAGDTRAAPGV